MIINKIKQLNIIKTVGKKTLVITTAFLVLGLAYSAYASGIIVFSGEGNPNQPKLMVSSLQSGLIGHWTLDADDYDDATKRVTDKTPYENHGTNYGASPAVDRNGKVNGAMSFDGLSSRVSISYPNPIKQTSVVAWFKKSGDPAGDFHIITGGGNVEVSIYKTGFLRTGVTTQTQGRRVFDSGSGLTDGNWHQVAMTYDGVNLKSFIDGKIKDSRSTSGDLSGTVGEIGRYLYNGYVANGSISDVRIYNRALSEGEILSLYDLYQPSVSGSSLQKGLVLDMPLTSDWTKSVNTGSEIMIDRTPFANDGINSGAAVGSNSSNFVEENDVVSVPGEFLNNVSNLTLSTWIKPNVLCEGTRTDWDIFLSRTDPWGYIGFSRSGSNFKASFMLVAGGVTKRVSAPNNININQWYHIVSTYNGSNIKIYIDGVEAGSLPHSGTTATVSAAFTIGGYANNYHTVSPNAEMSGVKIYNRALDATEVLSLYDQGR